ncbi:Deoxyribodipyrimidine photo-lyase [Papilio xuthus]|uniref:Deoxyribodipyrimidine photo-lyase n=1 Tax=Papilio xuthus TaxID=66420 RepID=A0A194PQS4_PAPXU|nr:Deoxyribodipyrimidine photo-lyase [Papilio xuthus]
MPSAAKKRKLASSNIENTTTKPTLSDFMNEIQKKREDTANSILNYDFNKKRVRIISKVQLVPDYCEGVVYWMSRDCRVQDNWAFLFAQKLALKNEVPLHVDAHNIIPCWIASEKQELTVWGMRNKIYSKLDEYLTEFPPVIKHPYTSNFDPKPIDWDGAIKATEVDKSVGPIEWASPGYEEAMKMLKNFLEMKLKIFATKRNDPTQDALSNLSPWFHFGLEKVAEECNNLNIPFHLLEGNAPNVLPQWVIDKKIGAVVCDFLPLRTPMKWVEELKGKLKEDIPLVQVDAHNIVPCWVTSKKQEYTIWNIRTKINGKLEEYLTEFPPLIEHPYESNFTAEAIDWDKAIETREADKTVGPIEWANPGYDEAMKTLKSFLDERLKIFADKRNDPTEDALSNLSPWFHFVQRVALCVQNYQFQYEESVKLYMEEAVSHRELADNFCFYSDHYDDIKGAYNWAQKTLEDHRKDKRTHIYSLEQLSKAETHDELWNSAQLQLLKEGKMHGFMRMYWGKKILEWTPSPEDALKYAIYLNDHYSIDGRDPNGYAGCMWSISGVHDHGWTERAVFGKVRYISYDYCKRKFDVNAFVEKYGGKKHKYIAAK